MNRFAFIENKAPTAKLFHSGTFTWHNRFGDDSKCILEVFDIGRKRFATAREVDFNPALSVTNGAEVLWDLVAQKFGQCIRFETYDSKVFDEVTMENGIAKWRRAGSWDDVINYVRMS